MKENKNTVSHDSTSYGIDADKGNDNRTSSHSNVHDRNVDVLEYEGYYIDEFRNNEDEIRDSAMLENQNGKLSQSNDCQRDIDPLSLDSTRRDEFCRSLSSECFFPVDGMTSCMENENRESVEPNSISSELLRKDIDLYIGENVIERELPQPVIVKDICIDDGVASIESIENYHKGLNISLPCDENKQFDMDKENVSVKLLNPEGFRSSEKYSDKHAAKESLTKGKMDTELHIQDGLQSSSSSLGENAKDASEVAAVESFTQIGEAECGETKKIKVCAAQKSLESSNDDSNNNSKIQKLSAEALVTRPTMVSSTNETNDNGSVDNPLYHSNVEAGTITFNFSSSKSTTSVGAEKCQNTPNRLLESQDMHDKGVSSLFAAAAPVSGLISHSGPLVNSGRISMRSDSSASGRSFAFPILQSEWNSSPVKMAKADRRYFRKQRCWKQGFLFCCRF